MIHDGIRRGIFYERGEAVDLLAILIADHASFDESKKLNVMGVFNEIRPKAFPYRHPTMMIVTRLSAPYAEAGRNCKLTIKLLDEDGIEMMNYPRDVVVQKPSSPGRRYNLDGILRVNNVEYNKAGTYEISVLIDDDFKGSVPLYVELDKS